MATQEELHLNKAREISSVTLRTWLSYNEGSPMRAAAETELERRRFWKNFLTSGIVSWIALIISILSLYISYAKYLSNIG